MLTNYNGINISYDAIGNPINWRNSGNLMWQGRRLTRFSHIDGEQYAYTYNADGIRTSKQIRNADNALITGVEYIYDGSKLVAESRNGEWLFYAYDETGAIAGLSYNNTLYFFRKNLQGDVTGIYNANGALIAEYSYTPYGAMLAITDANGNDVSGNSTHIANINPIRYRGYYYDTETGLYYLITRYYDPVVGRFLNADVYVSTGQGIIGNNMFAYCLNNPIVRHDPFGMSTNDCNACSRGAYGMCQNQCIIKRFATNPPPSRQPSLHAAPVCPREVINAIANKNIPQAYAVKVTPDSSGWYYTGSYMSGVYTVFTFHDKKSEISNYYFTVTYTKQKLKQLETQIYMLNALVNSCDFASYMGDVDGATVSMQVVGVVLQCLEKAFGNILNDLRYEYDYYSSLGDTYYEFHYVKTYKFESYMRGNKTLPRVYP